ncbi:M57 family metalloprotease [Aquimarina macrocephali]|uniref:M57 family metalloprotease n=1 Tax=Aquimarina macrocephali TaxID=666563 RepID=UPI0004630D5A|nr:M57 family metalloprotease [Aquimarina macrocephali]
MKKWKLLALCAIIAGFISSCQKDEVTNEALEQVKIEPTKAQLEKLHNMGVNTDNVTIEDFTFLDGSSAKHLVSGDITVPIADLNKYPELESRDDDSKQYRTPNLVSPPNRNIKILGYTGGGFALTPKMKTALSWAVFNYNVLPNTLNFTLSYGTNVAAADIVVYKIAGAAGGIAGFPTPAGKPYKWVRIRAGTDAYSTNVNEHVIGHEIGHCIGFRHQDWYNRQSCGYTGTLPAESTAIWIPGTPWSPNADSIMLACFGAGEDGELTPTDKTALNILY